MVRESEQTRIRKVQVNKLLRREKGVPTGLTTKTEVSFEGHESPRTRYIKGPPSRRVREEPC